MWIITQTGFLSAVQATDDPTTVVVRARVRGDLTALRDTFGDQFGYKPDVIAYGFSDYPYRVLVSREVLTRFLAEQVQQINYGNFKGRVAQVSGRERMGVYHQVWADLMDLEQLEGAE